MRISKALSGAAFKLFVPVLGLALGACQTETPPNNSPSTSTDKKLTRPVSIARMMTVTDHHANGYTGIGSLVAIVDTGIRIGLADFADRIAANSIQISAQNGSINDLDGHGTQMAGLIAANGSGIGTVGMAPDASLLIVRTDFDSNPGVPYASTVAQGIIYATDHDADIINLSLATNSQGVINAIQYAVDNDRIVVMATGNNGPDSTPSGIAQNVGTYGPTAIAVTAVDQGNNLAYFASPCDVDDPTYCVAAPGVNLATVSPEGYATSTSGTSAATAVVSGGIALMRQYFPDLTPEEIIEILLMTTTDLGAPGVDRVYGSGLVNFQAAMQPVGTVTVADLGTDASFSGSTAQISNAFGDALSHVARFASLDITDAYNRAYQADIRSALLPRQPILNDMDLLADTRRSISEYKTEFGLLSYSTITDSPLTGQVEDDWAFRAGFDLGTAASFTFDIQSGKNHLQPGPYSFKLINNDPLTSLVHWENDQSFSAHYKTNLNIGALSAQMKFIGDKALDATALTLAYQTNTADGFSLNTALNLMHENGAVFGSEFSGVFGEIAHSRSVAATLGANYQGSGFDLFASGTIGRSSVKMGDAGLITGFSGITFSHWAFGVGFNGFITPSDRLSFGLGQPVHIEKGHTDIFDGSTQSLHPSGREINAELSYRTTVKNTQVAANLVYGHEVGNINTNTPQLSTVLSFSRHF